MYSLGFADGRTGYVEPLKAYRVPGSRTSRSSCRLAGQPSEGIFDAVTEVGDRAIHI